MRRTVVCARTVLTLTCVFAAHANAGAGYTETRLVSGVPLIGVTFDANLSGPWGLALSATSPFWVADQTVGKATLYNGAGAVQALVVTVPKPAGGSGHPTGIVFNGTSDFAAKSFLFATEDGAIAGWAGSDGTTALIEVDNSAGGAVYKGLALANNGSANYLYATNFNAGTVDVFDAGFASAILPGNFTDPSLPAGYAPFGIRNLSGTLFVTYALQDGAAHDDVPGPGNGLVDEFDSNGNFLKRLATGGALNSPWGLALAPASFGDFSNDLLIGNSGDGTVNAFDPTTGVLLGTVSDSVGNPIVLPRVFGLVFGNGGSGGDPDTLYFTARVPEEDVVGDKGLLGELTVIPPETIALLTPAGRAGLAGALLLVSLPMLRRRKAA
jgi:uncharacterized protein (TIGR03118 family)